MNIDYLDTLVETVYSEEHVKLYNIILNAAYDLNMGDMIVRDGVKIIKQNYDSGNMLFVLNIKYNKVDIPIFSTNISSHHIPVTAAKSLIYSLHNICDMFIREHRSIVVHEPWEIK